MSNLFWPLEMPQDPATAYAGGPLDNRESFSARAGEPIERPLTSAPLQVYDLNIKPVTKSVFATFETWFQNDLGSGVSWFNFRHPIGRELRLTKFVGGNPAYTATSVSGGRLVAMSMQLMFRPTLPWYEPYTKAGTSRPPFFVADYVNNLYGVDSQIVPTSSLLLIEGTYLVQRVTSSGTTEAVETLANGDIPQNAPAGTTRIVGYFV